MSGSFYVRAAIFKFVNIYLLFFMFFLMTLSVAMRVFSFCVQSLSHGFLIWTSLLCCLFCYSQDKCNFCCFRPVFHFPLRSFAYETYANGKMKGHSFRII
jgi:hypothetical protein